MKLYHCDENLSLLKNLSLRWKYFNEMWYITVMKIYHCDEDESWWWELLPVMKIYHCKANLSLRRKIHLFDEYLH